MVFHVDERHLLPSENGLMTVATEYIPKQLMFHVDQCKLPTRIIPLDNDGEEILQALLCNSNCMLRMYGTAQELAANLKIYRNVPSIHKMIRFDVCEPYSTSPVLYKSLKGEHFLYKPDIFNFFQSLVFNIQEKIVEFGRRAETSETLQLTRLMLVLILKSNERRLDGCCEFVKYDDTFSNEIIDKCSTALLKIQQEFCSDSIKSSNYMLPPMPGNFQEMFSYFKKLTPEWDEEEYHEVEEAFRRFFRLTRELTFGMYPLLKAVADFMQTTVNSHPELFRPYSETKDPKAPIVVRIFEDSSQKFVMKAELYNAINIRNPNQKPLKNEDRNGILTTLTLDEVYKKYGNRIDKIEFIHFPIIRTKHKAVPVMTPTGDFCIPAADALLEIFFQLIICHKMFQRIQSGTWDIAKSFLSRFEDSFTPYIKCNYFITLETAENYEIKAFEFWTKHGNHSLKHVRNAKKDGFTVENLKNELKNLTVTDLFPEIIDYAEGVYEHVDKAKKEKVLRTCDLFDAVEQCQLICIFNRFPNFKQFLHTQKACHRIPHLKCEFCQANNLNLNTKVEPLKPGKPPGASHEESDKSSKTNKTPKTDEKQKALDDIKKTLMKSEKSDENEKTLKTENESKCCSKCLRSSELCNEAKKELKTTQNKLKNYETKAKRTEELERKMKEKDKEIEEFKERVFNLSNCIKENEALKLKIAQYDGKETRWKMTERNLIDSNSRILEKVALLETQLKSANQKIRSLEQEVVHLKETNEMEILEKTRVNKELSDTNLRLSVQNMENERTIQHLLDRLSSSPSSSIPTLPKIPIKEESGKYDGMRYQLVRLQKIKDSFRHGNQLKQAKEMVEKLISQTNRPVICPDYELQQFEGKIQNYIQAVEMSIQKLKRTGDPNDLTLLPDYPSFSERFMKEYWNEMKKQSLTSSKMTSELEDPECLICLSNVESSDETIKCEHCRRRYHSSCVTEWLKTKMECPTCRRALLNPTEYPSLS